MPSRRRAQQDRAADAGREGRQKPEQAEKRAEQAGQPASSEQGQKQGRAGQQEQAGREQGQQQDSQQARPAGRTSRPRTSRPRTSRPRTSRPRNQQVQNQQARTSSDDDDDGEGGSRRNRRRRGRDRERRSTQGGARNEPDTTMLEDDVLVPAAGILDVLDNYAFVRTSGYLPGPTTSTCRCRWSGSSACAAATPSSARCASPARASAARSSTRWCASTASTAPTPRRPRSASTSRLHARAPDRAAPPGDRRGQPHRARHRHRVADRQGPAWHDLAPPRPGTTTLLQSMAQSISRNNPECHLMVVLLDDASRRGHRLPARGEGRGHRLDLRPARQRPHHAGRARDRAGQAPGRAGPRRRRPARLGDPPGPGLQRLRTRHRSHARRGSGRRAPYTRPSSSSARPATSRTVVRSRSWRPCSVETGSATDEVIFEELAAPPTWSWGCVDERPRATSRPSTSSPRAPATRRAARARRGSGRSVTSASSSRRPRPRQAVAQGHRAALSTRVTRRGSAVREWPDSRRVQTGGTLVRWFRFTSRTTRTTRSIERTP